MRRGRLRDDAEEDVGASDRDRLVGRECRLAHPVAVELRAVRGTQVTHHGALAVPQDLDVLAARPAATVLRIEEGRVDDTYRDLLAAVT